MFTLHARSFRRGLALHQKDLFPVSSWFNHSPAISASEWILPASPGTCSIAVAKLVFMDAITFSIQAQMSVLTVLVSANLFGDRVQVPWTSQVTLMVKNPPTNAGDLET